MVDFTKPLQSIDGDKAEFVKTLTSGSYRNIVVVTSDGDHEVHLVDDDGDTYDSSGFIENAPEEKDEDGTIVLPSNLQFRVVTTKRGPGKVIKIRPRPGKKLGVYLDDDSAVGGVYWVHDKNVSLAR